MFSVGLCCVRTSALRRLLPAAMGVVLFGFGLTLPARAQAAPSPAAVKRGRAQFEQTCSFCHGADATGARGPDLVRSDLVHHDVNGNLIGQVVHNGRPDKGMPSFPLSDDQISDIAAFLHSQQLKALHSASVPGDYPLSRLLTGNAAAGKDYFNGAGHCNSCHSPSGDLAGVAKKFRPIDLEDRFLYPWGTPSTAVVTLPSGKQVTGTVVHQDAFSIALRDKATGWYESWPLSEVKVTIHDPLAAHRELLSQYTQDDIHNLFAYLETLK